MRPLCEGGLPVRFDSRLLDDLPMAFDEELVLNLWCWSPFAGCVAAINALTGVNVFAQAFLIPVGVVFYGAMRTLSDVQCIGDMLPACKQAHCQSAHAAQQPASAGSSQLSLPRIFIPVRSSKAGRARGKCTCKRMPGADLCAVPSVVIVYVIVLILMIKGLRPWPVPERD